MPDSIPQGSAVSGDGLARAYAAGHLVYPVVSVWGRCVGETMTGIPVGDCQVCGNRHPATREHCPVCGLATLFGHDFCEPS